MTKPTVFFIATLLAGWRAVGAAPAPAAEPRRPPATTAQMLGKLHASNQHEIEAGKLAKQHGNGKAVKELGDMLVKDHEAADRSVVGLAKERNIDLLGATPAEASTTAMVPPGPAFDAKFAQTMVEDHKRDIADATAARDSTTDDKLKQLLAKLIPTLQKHQEAAQKIVDSAPR